MTVGILQPPKTFRSLSGHTIHAATMGRERVSTYADAETEDDDEGGETMVTTPKRPPPRIAPHNAPRTDSPSSSMLR